VVSEICGVISEYYPTNVMDLSCYRRSAGSCQLEESRRWQRKIFCWRKMSKSVFIFLRHQPDSMHWMSIRSSVFCHPVGACFRVQFLCASYA